MKNLKIIDCPVSDLKQNPQNPRKHSKKQINQIKASIKEFGFVSPALIDRERQIIAGHGRMLAAKEIGMKTIPTVQLDHLSKAQIKALTIADNKLTENAAWDEVLLSEHFIELSNLELDFSLEITGFETTEIDLLIESVSTEPDALDDTSEVPDGPPVSKEGDIWQLGKHRIICGNSLNEETYKLLMEGKRAHMVFTDPPYNVQVNGHVGGLGKQKHREFAMASGEMKEGEFIAFLSQICRLLACNSKDGSLHYICMDWRHIQELMAAGHAHYTELKNLCIWVKDNGGMGSFYRSRHELVFVFKHGTASHTNNVELGSNGRYRTNVWEYAGVNSFARNAEEGNLLAFHPTVKPVPMVLDAILDCTKRNNIILDAFLGSGSTLIAAEKAGRRCYGIELDPTYIDTSIRRWQALTGDQAVYVASGKTFDEMEAGHE